MAELFDAVGQDHPVGDDTAQCAKSAKKMFCWILLGGNDSLDLQEEARKERKKQHGLRLIYILSHSSFTTRRRKKRKRMKRHEK